MSTYKCSNCSYTSKTKGLVTSHITRVAKCSGATLIEDIVKVKCEVCDKEFDTEALLRNHRKKCIEKKAIEIKAYVDPSSIESGQKTLTDLVMKLNDIVTELREQNNQLTKRMNRLEESNKRGYEDRGEDEKGTCEDIDEEVFTPKGYDDIVKREGIEGNRCYIKLKGDEYCRQATIFKDRLESNGVTYYYNKKDITRDTFKWAGDVKVHIEKTCENDGIRKNSKGCLYCDEHIKGHIRD